MTRKIALGVTTAATVFVLTTIAGLIVLMRAPLVDSTANFPFNGDPASGAAADTAQLRQAGYDQQLADAEALLARLQGQINGLAGQFGMQANPDAEFPVTGQTLKSSASSSGQDSDQTDLLRLDPTSQALADSITQITSLRASVDNVELPHDAPASNLTNEEWEAREAAYQQQLEQANALLAESYDAQTVDQMEQAYAEIVNDANARLSDAYFELEALQRALQEVRDRNALLIQREDLYQQQLEQAGRLLGADIYAKQSEPEEPGYETTYIDEDDGSSQGGSWSGSGSDTGSRS